MPRSEPLDRTTSVTAAAGAPARTRGSDDGRQLRQDLDELATTRTARERIHLVGPVVQ